MPKIRFSEDIRAALSSGMKASRAAAVRDVKGSLQLNAGGKTGVTLAGTTQVGQTSGSFELAASADKLVDANGRIVFERIPATLRAKASGLSFDAGGLAMRVADLDIDVTTGVRFHPLEIVLSILIKIVAVVVAGMPALGVVIFEVMLNVTSLFNHGNVALPPRLERLARWIVVTPQMHQVHHSIERAETDSNFGFNLPWWDRLFGTYRAKPSAGEQGMTIGLPIFRDVAELAIVRLLTQPFRREH